MVILAQNAGFCFGVKRAVDAVEKNIDKRIVTLGPLIHNKDVVQSLRITSYNVCYTKLLRFFCLLPYFVTDIKCQ